MLLEAESSLLDWSSGVNPGRPACSVAGSDGQRLNLLVKLLALPYSKATFLLMDIDPETSLEVPESHKVTKA